MRSSHIAASSLAAALPIATAAPEHCSEDFFKSILPENATLLFAESVAENCTFNVSPANIAYPKSPTNLPATCALQINVTTSATSAFSFGLFLPDTKTYNDRILGVGNGGFAGGVNWLDMAAGLHYGFASWSTDTGHNSTSGDLSWALNNEERRQDWGHRAIHGSAVMARQVAEAYYKAEAKYAYFSGCSTGGRQALREVQLHPETFDGVLAGAPAWWTDRLQTWSLWVGLLNLPTNSSSRIPPEAFPVIAKEVMAQCDWQDGLKDGIISDSAGCRFVPEALLCSSENDLRNQTAAECLTPHQLSTLKQIYSDYRGADNAFIFPGLELGSEEQWAFLMGAAKPSTYGSEFVQDFVLDDPSWDPTTAYNSTIPFTASARRPGNASATDIDLRPFHARGGKIIHHHGSADGLIPTGSSVYFHAQVQQTLQPHGVNPDDFYRFFVVPGMQHCAGTPADVGAPWYFAGPNQAANLGTSAYSVPGYQDAAHDELLALMAWVEEDKAPETLIATEWKGQDVKNGVRRQRPLCKWPEQARFLNEGSPDDAENWKCESIHGEHQPGYAQEEQVVGDSY